MKKLLCALLACLLMAGAAMAEIYEINGESELPAEWAGQPLLRLIMIDTNRSDAMLIECGGEAMMIDGAELRYHSRITQVLEMRGITHFKYLLASHSDSDHIHGLTYLMNNGTQTVEKFLSANERTFKDKGGYHQKAVRAAERVGAEYTVIRDGDVFELGGASITIMRCSESWGANNRSAVSLLQFGDARLLSPGDIDNQTMSWFAEHYAPEQLKCDILKIPHHGLATVPEDFQAAANPEMIIIPSTPKRVREGKRNVYNWALNTYGSLARFSGDGSVHCVTNGTDWYVWQDPTWPE